MELAAPAECARGDPALRRLGGGGRRSRRLGAVLRHGEPRGVATPVAAAPRAALPLGRGRDVPAAVPGGEPAVVGRGAADAASSVRAALGQPGRRLLQALHCWVWPNLLFWSVVPGHHFRHGLPLQPGLAGLAAMAWIALLTGRLRWPLPWLSRARVRRPAVGVAGGQSGICSGRRAGARGGSVGAGDGGTDRRIGAERRHTVLVRSQRRGNPLLLRPAGAAAGPTPRPRRDGEAGVLRLDGSGVEARPGAALFWLRDEQGDPMVLARTAAE